MTTSTTAITADTFLGTMGVNTHIGDAGAYSDIAMVEQDLEYLGVGIDRDSTASASEISIWQQVSQATGVKFDFYMPEGAPAWDQDALALVPQMAADGILHSIEGGNEEDDSYAQANGNSLSWTAQFQQQVYAMGQEYGLPVINMSFGSGWTAANNWEGDYPDVGNLSAYATYANAHTYPNVGQTPGSAIQQLNGDANLAASSDPVITTEMGWQTSQFSETQIAQYVVDATFDGIADGDAGVWFYGLYDDSSGDWGLFNSDGSPRPAATALHNLTTLLADSGSDAASFTAGSLSYSLSGTQSGDNSILIEKSDGSFWIGLWDESGSQHAVTVNLGSAASEIEVFDPVTGTSSVQSASNAGSISVTLGSDPLLIEVVPSGNSAPSSTGTSSTGTSSTGTSSTGTSSTGTSSSDPTTTSAGSSDPSSPDPATTSTTSTSAGTSTGSGSTSTSSDTTGSTNGATPTFDDQFSSLSLWNGSSGNWQPAYDWSPNGYIDSSMSSWLVNPAYGPTSAADADVYSINGNGLNMAIEPLPGDVSSSSVGGAQFLSGQLTTEPSFSQEYGYFQITAKLPEGDGVSSAFWLLPEGGAWPPEIDIFEADGSQGTGAAEFGVFTGSSSDPTQSNTWSYSLPTLSTNYNTFALNWTASTMTWYVNGQQVYQIATPAQMNQPMYMLIDDMTNAAGDWNGTPSDPNYTGDMQVQSVEVWQTDPYTNGGGGSGSSASGSGSTGNADPSTGTTGTGTTGTGATTTSSGTTSTTTTSSGTTSTGTTSTGTTSTGTAGTPNDLTVSVPASEQIAPGATQAISGVSVSDAWAAANPGDMALNVWDDSGTLTIDGQTFGPGGGPVANGMFSGSLAQINADLASLTYTAPSSGGSDTITVDVWNQAGVEAKETIAVTSTAGSASSGSTGPGTSTTTATGSTTGSTGSGTTSGETASSGPPTTATAAGSAGTTTDLAVTVPSSETVAAGTTTPISGISVSDSWAADNSGDMALNVWDGSGTLTIDGQTFGPGGGPVANGMFSGSLAQINADLASLAYTAPAGGGSDAITVDVWNQAGVEVKEAIAVTVTGAASSTSSSAGGSTTAADPTASTTSAATSGSATTTGSTTTATQPANTIPIAASDADPVEDVSNTAITATAGDHMLFIGGTGDTATLTGGTETVQAFQGDNAITTGGGNDTIQIAGSGNGVNAGGGNNTIDDSGTGNTIVLPSAGAGSDDIYGYVLQNGDTLDLRSALASTTWNGTEGTLGNFLSVSTVSNNAVISLSPTGSGAASAIATLQGTGPVTLTTLLQHAIA